MKFVLPLLLCLRAFGAMTVVQIAVNNNATNCNGSSGTSCAITVSSTGTGNALVFAIVFGTTAGDAISSVSGGCSGTWQVPAAANISNSGAGLAMAYCLSSSSGATTITATINNTNQSRGGTVYEITPDSGKTFSFDTANTNNDTNSSTTHTGTALTLTGADDLIVSLSDKGTAVVTAISGVYVLDQGTAENGQTVHAVNTATGTAPTWTTSNTTTMKTSAVALVQATPATFVPTVSNFVVGP